MDLYVVSIEIELNALCSVKLSFSQNNTHKAEDKTADIIKEGRRQQH